MDDNTSPILKSAIESFEHGLEHFIKNKPIDRKFAILHVDQAVELILKEKLASKGESVYKGTNETLNLHETFKKLERNNIKIPEKPRIEQTHEIRNMIQHRGHTPDEESTEFYIKIEYEFIKKFLKTEMGKDISKYIKPDIKAHLEGYEHFSSKNQIKSAYKQINENPTDAILGIFGALEFTVYQDFPNENLSSIISKLKENGSINELESKKLLKAYELRHRLSADNLYDPSLKDTKEAIEIVSNIIKKISGKTEINQPLNLEYLPEMINNYLNELKIKNYTRNTIKTYNSIITNFYKFLQQNNKLYDDKKLLNAFEEYIKLKYTQNISSNYIRHIIIVLKMFFEFYDINVLKDIKTPDRIEPNYEILTEQEVKMIMNTFGKSNSKLSKFAKVKSLRDKLILTLICSSRLKLSEIRFLLIDNVDINERKIKLTRKDDWISFDNEIKILIQEYFHIRETYLHKKRDSKFLFINKSGNHLSTRGIEIIVKKHAEELGIKKKVNPTILKKSFKAHLSENEPDIISLGNINDRQSNLNVT